MVHCIKRYHIKSFAVLLLFRTSQQFYFFLVVNTSRSNSPVKYFYHHRLKILIFVQLNISLFTQIFPLFIQCSVPFAKSSHSMTLYKYNTLLLYCLYVILYNTCHAGLVHSSVIYHDVQLSVCVQIPLVF